MTTQTNMTQPASLVQYGHAVLVSTSGKRPPKVIIFLVRKHRKMFPKIYLMHTLKISLTRSFPQENTLWTNNNFGNNNLI